MDRLEYHILLEETGVYEKREIKPEHLEACDSESVYQGSFDKKMYEIVPNDLSADEIRIALLAKQNKLLEAINFGVSFLAIAFVIAMVILGFLILFTI